MRNGAILLGVGFILGWAIAPGAVRLLLDSTLTSVAEVRRVNDDVISLQATAARQLTANSDLLLRASHYLDEHPTDGNPPALLCPVCGELEARRRGLAPVPEYDQPDVGPVVLPANVPQLLADSWEIGQNVGRAAFSLALQRDALRSHLKKLNARSVRRRRTAHANH